MKGLNKVELIGNLGADPEMRFTPTGKPVTTFSLATSRKFKGEDGNLVENTQWHNIVCWNDLAELANKALNKGSAVYISGSIEYQSWDGQDGQKHYRTQIVAGDVIFLQPKQSPSPAEAKPIDYKAAGQSAKTDKMLADATVKASAEHLKVAAVAMGAEPF